MLLNDKNVILVGGKGGVGKTTMSATLALLAAARGRKTLVVSTDPAHSLADAFGVKVGDPKDTLGVRLKDNLYALEIDPDREVKAHIERVGAEMKKLTRPEMFAEIERQLRLTQQSPGAQEAALLERIATILEQGLEQQGFDLIIFDTAPTGHTLRLLSLPEAMAAWTQGLLKHDSRSQKLAGVLDHLTPKKGRDIDNPMSDPKQHESDGMSERNQAISERLQARQRLFQRTRRLFTDPQRCAILFVLTPEKLPVLETQRSVATLQQEKLPLAGLIVNRVLPEDADGAFLAQRRQHEQQYLAQIEQSFAAIERFYVPLQAMDIEGMQGLEHMQTLLAQAKL
ncbi:MAG: arsenic-transporting ATPase [Idiomarina sp.]|nr:arsenic-transporting ATPase [Idiomarina sp.]